MRSTPVHRGFRALATALLAALALPSLALSAAPTSAPGLPRAATGGVGNVRGTSATLQGTVNPHGLATTYFFQYGPTAAYGSATPTTLVGSGTTTVKVAQTVANLPVGDHYRIVATNAKGTKPGRDRTYTSKKSKLAFAMADTKELPPTPYGGTFILRGTLSGAGGALQPIFLQSSAYPFLTAFSDVGAPVTTNAAGAFAIPVKGLTQSTQLRVRTNALRPLDGPIVTAHVAYKVTLKVRTSPHHRGLVRLYGTVTPAKVGARVVFQLEAPSRPRGKSEREVRYSTQESSVVKRGTRSFSRFSQVMTVRKSGRYRAEVVVRTGALVSGTSASITLHAAASGTKRK
ncbi:MAG TPA: hypothetical protein VH081_07485 [Solirubrobacteraceae bacterium]|jgi:hypothetical protein|nr:hypothetical protein [Solirubrobacteraceae bacterium]